LTDFDGMGANVDTYNEVFFLCHFSLLALLWDGRLW